MRPNGLHGVLLAGSLMMIWAREIGVTLSACAVLACSGEQRDARAEGSTAAADGGAALRAVPPPPPPYEERDLTAVGRVAGRIEITGDLSPDSAAVPTLDPQVCGPPPRQRAANVRRPSSVIVWLDGLRSGKRLPLERRYTVTHERCQLVPRTQAAIAGGTLNVLSTDPVAHTTRIVNVLDNRTLALVRQTGDGQVVPLDSVLSQPGRLELRCDLHPWTRGWLVVFDQPYFATATPEGSFAIDSVPPGRYRLVAWHEKLGEIADSITVVEGQSANVVLKAQVTR